MTWFKNLSVTLCLIGVLLIGYGTYTHDVNDDEEGTGSHSQSVWYGMIECLVATVSFGILKPVFTIFNDRYFPNWGPVQSALFMQGFNGILALLTLWPGFFIVHLMDIEPFELPSSKEDIFAILIPIAIGLVYSNGVLIGLMVTDPVFVAVMLLLVIPGTYIVDWTFQHLSVAWTAVTGSALIVIGALLLEIPTMDCGAKKERYTLIGRESMRVEESMKMHQGNVNHSHHTHSCTMSRTL